MDLIVSVLFVEVVGQLSILGMFEGTRNLGGGDVAVSDSGGTGDGSRLK